MAKTEPPRPIGRPKALEPGSSVSCWLRQSEHDRLARLAKQQDQSVSALMRHILRDRLK